MFLFLTPGRLKRQTTYTNKHKESEVFQNISVTLLAVLNIKHIVHVSLKLYSCFE